jgi:hypothetical protein
MGGTEAHVNFDAPAVDGGCGAVCISYKWRTGVGLAMNFFANGLHSATSVVPRAAVPIRSSTAPLMSAYGKVGAVLSEEHIVELARLRDFL